VRRIVGMKFIPLILFLLLELSSFGQAVQSTTSFVRPHKTLAEMDAARPSKTDFLSIVDSYSTNLDFGEPMIFRYDPTSTAPISDVVRAVPGGLPGRRILKWNGDVRAFGAIPFQSRYSAVPWGYKTTNSSIGTADFTVFLQTTLPTNYNQPYGMFEMGPVPGTNMSTSPDLLSSIGLRASPDVWGITFRSITGGSGAGSTVDDGAVLESSPSAISAYAGQQVNIVITRAGTNAAIYFNGTNVSSLFTLLNPAGWAKSLALGQPVHVQVGNNGNLWYWPHPIRRFALWASALSPAQAVNPENVSGKVIDFTPPTVEHPPDLTDALNRASDYASSIGGARIYLPPGVYRVDGEVRLGKNNNWVGAGTSPYPSTFRQGYRPTATTVVPWFGATNRVFYGDQTMSGEVCLTARGLSAFGNAVLSSRYLRSKISDMTILGDLSYSSEGIVLDRVASVEVDSIGFRGLQNHEIRIFGCNAIKIRNCDGGSLGRGVEVRGVADFDMRDCFLDGARGANVKMIANLSRIEGVVGEFALNARTSIPALESTASADASTDVITVTNSYGHKFHQGQAVRFDLDNAITATITVTNLPATGAALIVNGFNRTWSSTTTSLTIATNTTTGNTASNIVDAFTTYNLPMINVAQVTTNSLSMTLNKGFDLSVIPSSGWCSVSYVTNSSLPSPLSVNSDYFVVPTGDNTLKVSAYYADEVSLFGAMYSNSIVDITSVGTGTWYVGAGPSVGFYISGDHNSISGCQSQQNYEGALVVDGGNGNNAFTANHFIMSGLANNLANVPAVQVINSSLYNRFVNNSIDDRDLAFSQIGFFVDATSDYGTFSDNSWNINFPYVFADPAKQRVGDAKQSVFQWNGAYGNLYIPSRTGWSPWNVEDWEFASSMEFDKTSGRVYYSTGFTSSDTNFNYGVTFPAEGPIFFGGNSGTMSIVNNGAGQTIFSTVTTGTQYPIYNQVNSAGAFGYDIATFRNYGTNNTTFAALPAYTKLGELIYGGWYGSNSGDLGAAAGLSFWSDSLPWNSTNRGSQANILVTPNGSSSRIAAVTFQGSATPTVGDTMIILTWYNGTNWMTSSKRVSTYTNNSAGVGFQALRVPN
jgi:hypothetical protein